MRKGSLLTPRESDGMKKLERILRDLQELTRNIIRLEGPRFLVRESPLVEQIYPEPKLKLRVLANRRLLKRYSTPYYAKTDCKLINVRTLKFNVRSTRKTRYTAASLLRQYRLA